MTSLYFLTFIIITASETQDDTARTLWSGLKHVTGFTDEELSFLAKELLKLQPPAEKSTWMQKVHCEAGTCSGEVVARLMAALGENDRLPLRGFEPFPGDPLLKLWKEADQTEFESWVNVEHDDSGLPALLPEGQSLVIPRWQAAEFMRRAKEHILKLSRASIPGSLGRCLEWDTPFYIVKVFGSLCYRVDVLSYSAAKDQAMIDYPGGTRWLVVDITAVPDWFPGDYGIVVCLFVLEHVTDPKAALSGIVRALVPGGFLLLGAPFIDGVHACPDDYFRYTPNGLRHLVESVDLEVLMQYSPGTQTVSAGELIGMKKSYWKEEEVLAESDTHPTSVFILARKSQKARWWRPPRRNDSSPASDS